MKQVNNAIGRLLLLQGLYFLLTGLWALVHVGSFMLVTGPKTDVWLVKTIGAVFVCEGAGFIAGSVQKNPGVSTPLIAALNAMALIAIDVYYVSAGVISPVYLADAAAELLILVAWVSLMVLKVKAAYFSGSSSSV